MSPSLPTVFHCSLTTTQDVVQRTVLVTPQLAACICDYLPALENTLSRQDILRSSKIKTKQIILS